MRKPQVISKRVITVDEPLPPSLILQSELQYLKKKKNGFVIYVN